MGLQCWGDTSSDIIKDKVYKSTIPSVFGSCLSDWQVMLRLLHGCLVLSSFRVILCKKTGTFSNWSTTACVVTCIAAKQTAASLWSLSIWTSVRPYPSHPNMCLSYRSSLVHRMSISWLEHNSLWLALHRTKLLPPCEAFLYEHPFVPTCPIQRCACRTGVAWCTEWTYLDWSTTACDLHCMEPNCCLLVKPFYMNIRSSLLVPSKHVPVVRE